MENILTKHYEVSEKLRKVSFIEEDNLVKKVQELFGTEHIEVSGEYLEGGNEFRHCKAKLKDRDDLYISIGFRRGNGNGKISIYKTEVVALPSALLDPSTFTKVIHVSHDDLDGESPLIFSRLAFADKEVITRGCSYDKVDEITMSLIETEMKKEDTVMFITDISLIPENSERVHKLVQQGFRIFMIDHHDPKEGVPVNKYASWMKLDQEYPDGRGTAATSMYYEFLIENGYLNRSLVMDDYVELVRLFDTWEWDEIAESEQVYNKENLGIRAKRLNDYYFMGNREEFSEQVLMRFTDQSEGIPARFTFDYHVEYMLDMEQRRIDEFCKKKKKQMVISRGLVDGTDQVYSYGIVIAENYQSELGNYLCKEFIEDIDFVVMIDVGRAKMSLRSNKKKPVHVGAIARSVGGGGRAQTAGCPLNAKTKYLFLDQLVTSVVV